MWTISDLKKRGLAAFKANYWKAVLVGLVLFLISGGVSSVGRSGSYDTDYLEDKMEETINQISGTPESSYDFSTDDDFNFDAYTQEFKEEGSIDEIPAIPFVEELTPDSGDNFNESDMAPFIAVILLIVIVVFVIAFTIGECIRAFLFNPLETGCKAFFRNNLDEPASISYLGFSFDSNYMNIVKTMFFRDLYTILWSLLFIIPGIIKRYEYAMIPYILSENPDISTEEAFAESRELMNGNKWNLFVLQLSFLGWHVLSIFTLGLLEVFFTQPYLASTEAAFYEAVKYGITGRDDNDYSIVESDAGYYSNGVSDAKYYSPEANGSGSFGETDTTFNPGE